MKNQILNVFDIIKTYRWRSIFFVYFKKILSFILISLIIISLLASFYIKKNFEYNYQINFNEAFYKTYNQLGSMFEEIETYYDLINNQDLMVFLDSLSSGRVDRDFKSKKNLLSLMSTSLQTANYISNISVYRFTDNYILSPLGGGYLGSYYNTRWLDLHEHTGKNNIIYYNVTGNNSISDTLTISTAVYSGDEIIGFIIFEINDYILKNTLTFTHNKDIVSILADTQGNILYSTDRKLHGRALSDVEKKPGFRSENATSYIFATCSLSNAGAVPTTSIISILISAILLSLILSAVIALYFAFQFYQSIFSLYTTFATADVYSEKANNEISQIISSVMKVVEQNEQFEKELNEKVISLRKSQSIALQTQLNPHFLFNTLNMINLMAINLTKSDNDVSRVIMLLSELLRESLNTQEYLVPLKTEIEYVEKFIEIEKIKHRNNFTVNYDISEETKECKVIKFMLQPIVENAFEHGTHKVKSKEKYISISTYNESGNLIVSVKNNGEEIPVSKLTALKQRLKTDIIPEDKHIGMFNVNSRIKIVFGSQYGCEINSEKTETEVKLILPFE